ncbi:uncharacterized protein ACN427_013172 [Glossina fuscipes fuscipes]
MKFFIVLFALINCIAGEDLLKEQNENQVRSISDQIKDQIEAAKEQMPCGFPGLGIPPLAPLRTSHQELKLNKGFLFAEGEIKDFRLDGLNDFDIDELNFNLISQKLKFKFTWSKIHFKTDYALKAGFNRLAVHRAGDATFAVHNATVWGTIRYSISLSGTAQLKELSLYAQLDDVESDISGLSDNKIINKKLNEFVEEWVTLAVNENTDNLAEITNQYAKPIINELIRGMNILDWILGGGDNDPEEKEPCIPPEDI